MTEISPITCAACHTAMQEPAARVGAIVVCASCGASLHVDETGVRLATGADTADLSAADLQVLRTARGRIARPDRKQS